MLLATINSGTLIIALPDLEGALDTSILALVWVILAYMIASTVLVLTAGRLSDLFGRKRAYVGGFVLFGIASLGAGFASDGTTLILWRVLQGIGGAFLFANSSALVTDAFPREQLGLAMGTNTMVAAVGLVLGPVLGGALVAISWHWVFWFNVPFTALGAIWAGLVLRELAKPDDVRELDLLGTITFVVGLTGLVLGISRGGISGWDDPLTVGSLIAGVVLLPLFVLDRAQPARRDARPLDLREPPVLGRDRGRVHQRALALRADVPVRLLLPGRQGRRPDHGGDRARADGDRHARRVAARRRLGRPPRLAPAVGARHARDRRRARSGMTTLGIDSSRWWSSLWLFVVGVGSGMFNSPNTAAMMGTVPPHRRGIAAGTRTMLQNTGAVISIAFVLAIVTSAVPKDVLFAIFSGVTTGLSDATLAPFVHNMHTALWVLAATSLVGVAVSLMRPPHRAEVAAR